MDNVDCGECPHVSDGCQGFCEKIEIGVSRWDANWHMEEFYEHKHGDYVRVADFYAAQSELTALREELVERNEVIAMKAREVVEAQTAVTGWATKCKAAEQRNSDCVALLRRSSAGDGQDLHTWWNDRALILQAALKPVSPEATDPCAHSYANKLGCPECGEEFEQVESGASE